MDAKNNNDNIAKTPTDREEWIAVRRSALYDYFNLPEKNKAEAEALFDKMRALTAECADQGEFETRLAQSPLNKEYTDLFTKNSRHVKTGVGMGGKKGLYAGLAGSMAANSAVNIGKQQLRNRARGWLINALPDEVSDWLIYNGITYPCSAKSKPSSTSRTRCAAGLARNRMSASASSVPPKKKRQRLKTMAQIRIIKTS